MRINQSGYIRGRNICDNIRSIIDLMEYTKERSEPGILFSLILKKLLIV